MAPSIPKIADWLIVRKSLWRTKGILVNKGGYSVGRNTNFKNYIIMQYEVEAALGRKADKWRVDALQSELEHLNRENRDLRQAINNISFAPTNAILHKLLDILIRDNPNTEYALTQLKHSIY